ncbi:MAG: beta-ketoacyl synthase N-terminal-like domain-containing protein, partial [Candidatus Rokuibacteriota bacterium]
MTGLGIVSPIGVGVEKFWAAATAGKSGIRTPTLFDSSKLPPDCRIVGEVTDFDPLDWMPARVSRMAGRFSQFAVSAARMARTDSGLDAAEIPPEQLKVSIGTSMNGQVDLGESTFSAFLRGQEVSPWT